MFSANLIAMRAFSFVGLGAFPTAAEPQETERTESSEHQHPDIDSTLADSFAPGGDIYEAVAEALVAAGFLKA